MLSHVKRYLRKKKVSLNFEYFLIGFSIVMFWRASWWLLDHYFLPSHPVLSHVISMFIALIIFLGNDGKLDELGKL